MKLLQINTSVNSGSTGRIAEEIGKLLIANGHQSIIAFGRGNQPSESETIRIGNDLDIKWHGLKSRLFDRHGFGSGNATKLFVKQVEQLKPDIIHFHNLHGYYLNVEVLFKYLRSVNIPIVWTFHDCWPFTGHCSFFDYVNCFRWKTGCFSCPNKHGYPESLLIDNSRNNYNRKKQLFSSVKQLQIITPSNWLSNHVTESFLKGYPVQTIHNGIDLTVFKPMADDAIRVKYNLGNKKIILGVASTWDRRKGLDDFIRVSSPIGDELQIVLVGLNTDQLKDLPQGIMGIARTENTNELAALYSAASVFVNPTYVDNFPTTNLEALACGTPVITYNTGGSPESIDANTGIVVVKGDINGLHEAILEITAKGEAHYQPLCRERAVSLFNKDDRYMDYLHLYKQLLAEKNRKPENG